MSRHLLKPALFLGLLLLLAALPPLCAQTLGPEITLGQVDEEGLDSFFPAATFNPLRQEFIVFYLEERNDTVVLLAQSVDSQGQVAGQPVEVAAPAQGMVGRFAVGYSPQTDSHLAVWGRSTLQGSPQGLFARVLDGQGRPDGATVEVTPGAATNPSMAYDPYNRRFLVVWEFQTGFGTIVDAAFVQSDGTIAGDVQTTSGGTKSDPDVAFNPATGEYLWVWLTGSPGIELRGQIFDGEGTPQGVEFAVRGSFIGRPDEPVVAANPLSSDLLVAWDNVEESMAGPDTRTVMLRRIGPQGSRTAQFSAAPVSSSAALGFAGRNYVLASTAEDQQAGVSLELLFVNPGLEDGQPPTGLTLTQAQSAPPLQGAFQPAMAAGADRLLVLWSEDAEAADDFQVRGRIITDLPAPSSELSFAPGGTVGITPGGLLAPSTLHSFERTSQLNLMDDDLPVTRILEVDRGSIDLSNVEVGDTLYQSEFSLTVNLGLGGMEAASGRIDYIVRAKDGGSALMEGVMASLLANPLILAMVPLPARNIPSQLLGTAISSASLLPGEGDGLVLLETFLLPLHLRVSDDYRMVGPELAISDTFLESFYRTPASAGPLQVSSSVIALRGRSEGRILEDFTVQEENPPPPDPELPETLHFAQFGGGGGLASQLILGNAGGEATMIRLEIRDQSGDPLTLTINSAVVSGSLEAELPAQGVRIFQTEAQGQLASGSLTIRSQTPIGGVVLFGGSFGLAGVGPSQPLQSFQVPVEVRALMRRTGLAIYNLEAQEVSLNLTLSDQDGIPQAGAQVMLAPMGQISRFTDEIDWDQAVDFSNFVGQVTVVASQGQVAATAIQVRPGQFASLPVLPRPNPTQ
ncbi:MAG TPA: hypothetical protein VLU25_22085 [Acidobacteriota bacterium]|nr:hypothetical protein [Acidobacteriota bacterium]